MSQKTIKLFNGKAYGHKVSSYGLANGYLDYYTLSLIVGGSILNNEIIPETGLENWEMVNGDFGDEDEYREIYQYYIITWEGYKFLHEYTDEFVFYNDRLDMFVWGITHFGTSWDYVLTDVRLVGEDEPNDDIIDHEGADS